MGGAVNQRNGWDQIYGNGGKPWARGNSFGGTPRGQNKGRNADQAKQSKANQNKLGDKPKVKKDEVSKKVKTAAAREESDGRRFQLALIQDRIATIQSPIPGVRDSSASGEEFTLGTRVFKITHILSKGEVATQVEIQRALVHNTLTGKPCGWFVCLRAQNYELIVKEGANESYGVVPARSCITQISGISLRCTTDDLPVVFTTGVPGGVTDQMGNLEAAVFGKETSDAGPRQVYHSTKFHNVKTAMKSGHERMCVTRPYGGEAGMLYTVGAFYQPATFDTCSSEGTSIGFVSGEVKVRTYEREVDIPAGYKFVEDKLVQVVPIYDPLLLVSGGYQDDYRGGEVVGKYDLVSGRVGTGEFVLSILSEGLAGVLSPAVTYQFHEGFDRNVKTQSTQVVAQPVRFKYMRLCKIGAGTELVHVFSSLDASVNARPEKGFLDEGISVGVGGLKYTPVTGSWGSALGGSLCDAGVRNLDSTGLGKKPSAYTVTKTKRHPDTVGPLPMVLGDGPPFASSIGIDESYQPNTATGK